MIGNAPRSKRWLGVVLMLAFSSAAASQEPDASLASDETGPTAAPETEPTGEAQTEGERQPRKPWRPVVHVVRPGETLASIAQRYYGDPRRESMLVEENGLTAQGGAAIVVGMRLAIPFVAFHCVGEGESWGSLAERFYGSADRAFLLIDINRGSPGDQPDVGAELIVPYPLRHTAEQNEDLRQISSEYYGNNRRSGVRRLRRFNAMRGIRPARGQVVLVPLQDLVLSEEGLALAEAQLERDLSSGETRQLQEQIDDQLPALREHNRNGRFAEALTLGNHLLGAGQLTGNQVVTIQRELATGYVALDRRDLAREAFLHALRRQPHLELDITRTSPKVRQAFDEARERLAAGPALEPPRDAGAPEKP